MQELVHGRADLINILMEHASCCRQANSAGSTTSAKAKPPPRTISTTKFRSRSCRRSQIFSNQFEIPERSLSFRAGHLERPFQVVADMVMNQGFFGVLDGAFDGLELLSDFRAGLALLNHPDDRFKVAIGALQTAGDR